jgi:hypothetical protein
LETPLLVIFSHPKPLTLLTIIRLLTIKKLTLIAAIKVASVLTATACTNARLRAAARHAGFFDMISTQT